MKLLIIEDESELASDIVTYLHAAHYLCEIAPDFKRAIEKIDLYQYDCILLDLMLPDGDGFKILDHIKQAQKQDGVIIISAKNAIDDKVRGLEAGADDFLSKPFHLAELLARIYSLIRRKQFNSANLIEWNEIRIDPHSRTVTVQDIPVVLTKKEFDLLLLFIGNKNKVISKGALAEHLSGDLADMLDSHDFIYAHVKNLKKKLTEAGCAEYIKTIYGTGYIWKI